MAAWGRCTGCRTEYRVRLFRCPRCHGTTFKEESMPKSTRSGGASNAAAGRVQEAAARPLATGGVVKTPVVGEDTPPAAVLPPADGGDHDDHELAEPTEGVEAPADGTESPEPTGDESSEAPPPIEEAPPARRTRRSTKRAAGNTAATGVAITADATVTRPDGTSA